MSPSRLICWRYFGSKLSGRAPSLGCKRNTGRGQITFLSSAGEIRSKPPPAFSSYPISFPFRQNSVLVLSFPCFPCLIVICTPRLSLVQPHDSTILLLRN